FPETNNNKQRPLGNAEGATDRAGPVWLNTSRLLGTKWRRRLSEAPSPGSLLSFRTAGKSRGVANREQRMLASACRSDQRRSPPVQRQPFAPSLRTRGSVPSRFPADGTQGGRIDPQPAPRRLVPPMRCSARSLGRPHTPARTLPADT